MKTIRCPYCEGTGSFVVLSLGYVCVCVSPKRKLQLTGVGSALRLPDEVGCVVCCRPVVHEIRPEDFDFDETPINTGFVLPAGAHIRMRVCSDCIRRDPDGFISEAKKAL